MLDTTTPIETLRAQLRDIEMKVLTSYTLADAMREGISVTRKAEGTFGHGDISCALGAAGIAVKARGYVD